MSRPEKPRVEIVPERLKYLIDGYECPPGQCVRYKDCDGDCLRCWLEYLKGEYPHE